MNDNTGMTPFEKLLHSREDGSEYWSARELSPALGYTNWRNFKYAIEKAKISCRNSGNNPTDHFDGSIKMIITGKGAKRQVEDVLLSRYACYLVVENADPAKPVVALGQTYFAGQTRRAELDEEGRRIWVYDQLREQTELLKETVAGQAGVIKAQDFAIFQDYGYMGLYNGETSADIRERKNLKPNQSIVDHMSRLELAANLFRASQADAAISSKGVISRDEANALHYKAGQLTRKAIADMSNSMPEAMPNPTDNIQTAKKRQQALKQTGLTKKTLPNETEIPGEER